MKENDTEMSSIHTHSSNGGADFFSRIHKKCRYGVVDRNRGNFNTN